MTAGLVIDAPAIRRLRAALDEVGYDRLQRALRGSLPRVPHPPHAEFATTLRRLDPRLRPWFDLLLLGRSLPVDAARAALGAVLDDLVALNVLSAAGGRVRPCGLALAAFFDRYVLARIEALYPAAPKRPPEVYIGPSSYRLAVELPYGRRLRSVLDLCSGSGLLAILMAPAAERVVAADLLPDAAQAARFNVLLNGVDDRVEVRQGDLFEPVRGERFDFVVFNSPFVTSPAGVSMSVLASGGPDGLEVVRRILGGLRDHLAPNGWALAYFESEGDRAEPLLARRLGPVARAAALDVELTLAGRTTIAERLRQMRVLYARAGRRLPPEWMPFYRDQGADRYYSMIARIRAGSGRVTTVNAIPRG